MIKIETIPVKSTSPPSIVANGSFISIILSPSRRSIVRIISTSFNLPGNPGRHISAVPSQMTAVSSTKTPSGNDSSAGNSITSRPSFLNIEKHNQLYDYNSNKIFFT